MFFGRILAHPSGGGGGGGARAAAPCSLATPLRASVQCAQARQTRPINSVGVAESQPRFDKGGLQFFLLFTR